MNIRKFVTKAYINTLRCGEPVTWNLIHKISTFNIDYGNNIIDDYFDEESDNEDNPDSSLLRPSKYAEFYAHECYTKYNKEITNFSAWNLVSREILDELANKFDTLIDDKQDEDHYNLDLVCQIFNPTDAERRALNIGLYMRHKTKSGQTISTFLDRVLPGFSSRDHEVMRLVFGFSFSDIENVKTGNLYTTGVLVSHSTDEYFTIGLPLGDIFQIENLTIEHIREKLFKNSLIETSLDVSSFDHISKEVMISESILTSALANKTKGINIFLWGEPGTGKTELPFVLARKMGWDIIPVGDVSTSNSKEQSRSERLVNLKLAQSIFNKNENTILLFDEFEDVANMDNKNSKAFINRLLETTDIPIIWTTNHITNVDRASLRRMTYNIEFKLPNSETRKKIWQKYNEKYDVGLDDEYLGEISEKHEMSPSLIHNAMRIASSPDIGREHIPHIIDSLNKLVNYGENPAKPKFKEHAGEIYNSKYSNANLDIGKLTDQINNAKGNFSLCLYGPSGTGKSEYGKYISKVTGKKILYKRASDLGSEYISVTERKIAAAFEQASEENKILMIDEGDSFLRDRNMAKHSWEVTQVNEMLSQMEMSKCNFILTTNLIDTIDAAALRRFTFKIKFDYLTKEQNVEIFRHYFNIEAPDAIRHLDKLTPGDFAAVKQKIDIMGFTDANDIFAMLKDEVDVKDPFKKERIGF